MRFIFVGTGASQRQYAYLVPLARERVRDLLVSYHHICEYPDFKLKQFVNTEAILKKGKERDGRANTTRIKKRNSSEPRSSGFGDVQEPET